MKANFIRYSFISAVFILTGSPLSFSQENQNKVIFDVGYSTKVFQNVNLRDAKAATHILTKKIVQKTGLDIGTETIVYNDLESIEKALNSFKLDLIALLPEEYLAIKDHVAIYPYLATVMNGDVYDEHVVLARKDREIKKLRDLKDKRLIISIAAEGDIPVMWLEVTLNKEGLPRSEKFFSSIKMVDQVSQAVIPVFLGQMDACIVTNYGFNTMMELNPQVGQMLQVLITSPKYANGLSCINNVLDEESYREIIERTLRELHTEPEGRQILALFKAEKFVLFEPSFLENVEILLREFKDLKLSRD